MSESANHGYQSGSRNKPSTRGAKGPDARQTQSAPTPESIQGLSDVPPEQLHPTEILALQRVLGNRAVQRMLQPTASTASPSALTPVRPGVIQRTPEEADEWLAQDGKRMEEELGNFKEPYDFLYKIIDGDEGAMKSLAGWREKIAQAQPSSGEDKTTDEEAMLYVFRSHYQELEKTGPLHTEIEAGAIGKLANYFAHLRTLFTDIVSDGASTQNTQLTKPGRFVSLSNQWEAEMQHDPQEADEQFWQTEQPGVRNENRRQIVNPGNPAAKVPVEGGEAWMSHGVDFLANQGKAKRKGGFSFDYQGANAAQTEWLQFLSIEMIETKDGKQAHVMDGDERVMFTTDPQKRVYGVDYASKATPVYESSFRSETQSRMTDDPMPCTGIMKNRIEEGASKVVEIDQFDTFLLVGGRVVFRGTLKVTFECDAGDEQSQELAVTKKSELMQSGEASQLPPDMEAAMERDASARNYTATHLNRLRKPEGATNEK